MRTYRGDVTNKRPIIKRIIDDEWICSLTSGSIRILLNFEEYEITVHQGKEVFFIVHDGQVFSILEGSSDYELQVQQVSHDILLTLYPQIGKEANAGLYSISFITSAQMKPEIGKMLSLDFQQLRMMSRSTTLIEYNKMLFHLFIHFYLTFYNGIGKVGIKSSTQSFNLMNRFYELFSEKESFLHRDTKYFADRLNITVRYLFEICTSEAGKTPKDIINEAIIGEITQAMLTSDLSFQELSIRFNFPDQTAFTQFFKRNTGMTPSEFRKKYK